MDKEHINRAKLIKYLIKRTHLSLESNPSAIIISHYLPKRSNQRKCLLYDTCLAHELHRCTWFPGTSRYFSGLNWKNLTTISIQRVSSHFSLVAAEFSWISLVGYLECVSIWNNLCTMTSWQIYLRKALLSPWVFIGVTSFCFVKKIIKRVVHVLPFAFVEEM